MLASGQAEPETLSSGKAPVFAEVLNLAGVDGYFSIFLSPIDGLLLVESGLINSVYDIFIFSAFYLLQPFVSAAHPCLMKVPYSTKIFTRPKFVVSLKCEYDKDHSLFQDCWTVVAEGSY